MLKRLIATTKLLQSVNIGVDTAPLQCAVELYDSLRGQFEKQALSKSVTQTYECRNRQKKMNSGTERRTGRHRRVITRRADGTRGIQEKACDVILTNLLHELKLLIF